MAVFAPDRLSLVKGPPAERRAHLDGFLAARWPARGELRKRFGQALAQRNAMISRIAAGYGSPDGLDVWDAGLAEAAAPLIAARAEAIGELAPAFAEALAELGLAGGELLYAPRAEGDAAAIRDGLGERRDADLKLGRSSWGPHLDEVKLNAGGRALRKYGSQGQQRAALLALLFAEREALLTARRVTPLLLLDDVMSELDPGRRELLVARLAAGGQTLITAADEESLPGAGTGVDGPHAPSRGGRRRARRAGRRIGGRVTRRRAPREASEAFRAVRDQLAPKTGLAAVQAAWSGALGERLAIRRDAGVGAGRDADGGVRRWGLGAGARPDAGAAFGAAARGAGGEGSRGAQISGRKRVVRRLCFGTICR